MRDFGNTRYCRKCGNEIIFKGDLVTFTPGMKFCECKKEAGANTVVASDLVRKSGSTKKEAGR